MANLVFNLTASVVKVQGIIGPKHIISLKKHIYNGDITDYFVESKSLHEFDGEFTISGPSKIDCELKQDINLNESNEQGSALKIAHGGALESSDIPISDACYFVGAAPGTYKVSYSSTIAIFSDSHLKICVDEDLTLSGEVSFNLN